MVLVCLKWLMLHRFRQSAAMLVPNSLFPSIKNRFARMCKFVRMALLKLKEVLGNIGHSIYSHANRICGKMKRSAQCVGRDTCMAGTIITRSAEAWRGTLVFCSPKNWPLNSQNWLKILYTIVPCVLRAVPISAETITDDFIVTQKFKIRFLAQHLDRAVVHLLFIIERNQIKENLLQFICSYDMSDTIWPTKKTLLCCLRLHSLLYFSLMVI